jgi:hypothetical protein
MNLLFLAYYAMKAQWHEEFDAAILQLPEREVKKFGMGCRFCDEWLDGGMKSVLLGRNAKVYHPGNGLVGYGFQRFYEGPGHC